MTLEQLLHHARLFAANPDPNKTYTAPGQCGELLKLMSQGIVDLLGEAHPCGFTNPRAIDGEVWFTDEIKLGTKSESRALAASILRAADQLPDETT